ncbi:MAG: TVP38/TMEM64 family protein [Gemmatimonadales bacterium]
MIPTPRPLGRAIRAGLAAVAIVGLVWLARTHAGDLPALIDQAAATGPAAGLLFAGLYAIATVAWVPGSVLTLAAGATFGLAGGTLYTLVGATLGAAAAFLVSRHLAREAIEAKLAAFPKLSALDDALALGGWRIVLLIRLSPLFPFNALNYALGLTRVRFRDYVTASFVGMAPGTFLYVYSGHVAGRLATDLADGTARFGRYAMLGAGLVATVAATVLVTRAARRALAAASVSKGASTSR